MVEQWSDAYQNQYSNTPYSKNPLRARVSVRARRIAMMKQVFVSETGALAALGSRIFSTTVTRSYSIRSYSPSLPVRCSRAWDTGQI